MAKEDKAVQPGGQSRPPQTVTGRPWSGFDEVDRLFDEFLSRGFIRPSRMERGLIPEFTGFEARVPKVDVIDRENELLVRAELPGVSKDDLEITLEENAVSIKASTKQEQKEEQGDYYRCEISRSAYARTIGLPAPVDGEKAKANFKDGVLELTLPKQEKSQRRRITVG